MPFRSHYNRNQPRVPAGHHDGGQWTAATAASRLRNTKMSLGPPIQVASSGLRNTTVTHGLPIRIASGSLHNWHFSALLRAGE